jgi:ribose-phosphate pyrophosphokinase
MNPIILPLPGNEPLAAELARAVGGTVGAVETRRFPDGETFVRILSDVAGRDAILVAQLHKPDDKFLPLAFLAATARDLRARRVGLVAPYLAYMRQDRAFSRGEGVTARYFASLVSHAADWLVTVDPHLHRQHALSDLYTIPVHVVHAAGAIAAFIRAHYPNAVLIGPDHESEQWVAAVAKEARVPFIVLRKERRGDRDVRLVRPDLTPARGRMPIVIDDIVSTGRTMIAVARQLQSEGHQAPVCIGVHAVLDHEANHALYAAGITRLVTCNTVQHESNAIDLSGEIAAGVRAMLSGAPAPPSTSPSAPLAFQESV